MCGEALRTSLKILSKRKSSWRIRKFASQRCNESRRAKAERQEILIRPLPRVLMQRGLGTCRDSLEARFSSAVSVQAAKCKRMLRTDGNRRSALAPAISIGTPREEFAWHSPDTLPTLISGAVH